MSQKLIQGDSLWLDIPGDISGIDPTWANWSGTWTISTTIGSPALVTGSLIKTTIDGQYRLQVSPIESASLSVGTYYLCVQVDNATVSYRKEILQEKLVISPQGVMS